MFNEDKVEFRDEFFGLLALNQNVKMFDFGNVIVKGDYLENDVVRIISGGSQNYGEFVGKGMLTCAVHGSYNNTAPTPKVILRTIREMSYKSFKGVLLLIPKNSSNLLSFGLAVERALNDHLPVKLIEVSDNTNPPTPLFTPQKNNDLPSIIFLYKIAGAMAEKNMNLDEINQFCTSKITNNIFSRTVELTKNNTYRCVDCINSKNDTMERGVGKRRTSLSLESSPATASISEKEIFKPLIVKVMNAIMSNESMLRSTRSKIDVELGGNVVVLINNCGRLTKNEEFCFIKDVIDVFGSQGITIHRLYSGNFLFPSNEVTISILKLDDYDVLEYLDDPCSAPGWKSVYQTAPVSIRTPVGGCLMRSERLSPPIRGPKLSERYANIVLFAVQFACEALISCEKQLNNIDSERGNGDTGKKLKYVSKVLLKRMQANKLITDYPFTFFSSLSKILEATVEGSSGCIYSILFEAAASYFGEMSENTEITAHTWLQSFYCAAAALQKYGNVQFGDGTMYDPIVTFIETTNNEMALGTETLDAFNKGVEMAEQMASMTKKYFKFPDSGAHAVAIWIRAVFEAVKLRLPIYTT